MRQSEAVVGLAAEQQRIGGGQLTVDGRAHFVVEMRKCQILRVLDDAVEGDEPAVIFRIEATLIILMRSWYSDLDRDLGGNSSLGGLRSC